MSRFSFCKLAIRTFAAAACFLLGPATPAQQTANERAAELRAKTAKQMEQLAASFDGVMGIAAKDLTSGESFHVNADRVFPQASAIKIPVLVELYRQAQAGTLKLEERVNVSRAQMAAGSGVLQNFSDGGSAIALRDLAVLMIVLSDNTATNILIDRVGMQNVNEMLVRNNLRQTRLQRKMLDTESQRAGRENLSTPQEMIWLLGLLHERKLLDAQRSDAVLEILRYPKSSHLRRGLPPRVPLASKTGGLAGVATESGIVLMEGRPYAISVMTTYAKEAGAAEAAIGEASRLVFDYFERVARSNAMGARMP